jgi:hypothetical protein
MTDYPNYLAMLSRFSPFGEKLVISPSYLQLLNSDYALKPVSTTHFMNFKNRSGSSLSDNNLVKQLMTLFPDDVHVHVTKSGMKNELFVSPRALTLLKKMAHPSE